MAKRTSRSRLGKKRWLEFSDPLTVSGGLEDLFIQYIRMYHSIVLRPEFTPALTAGSLVLVVVVLLRID